MGWFDKKQPSPPPPRPRSSGPRPTVTPGPPPGPLGLGERSLLLEQRRVVALESIAASFKRYVDGQFA